MKPNISIVFLFLFILFMNVGFTLAAPPFLSNSGTNGYQIKVPLIDTIKQNQDFNFNFHVFNLSNGVQISNASTSCALHLYLPNGTQILETTVPHANENTVTNEWEILVKGGNFSYLGENAYNIQCNSTTLGGFASVSELVTVTGQTSSIDKAVMYVLMFFISFIIFAGLLVAGILLPAGNKSDDMTGFIIATSNMKYVKIFCFAFAYLVGIFLAYLSWIMSLSYLDFDFLPKVFQFLFYGLAWATIPFFLLLIYFLIANWIRDAKITEMLQRGLTVRG